MGLQTRIPDFETGYMGKPECEVHVQHMWCAVPQAECSSSLLSFRKTLH